MSLRLIDSNELVKKLKTYTRNEPMFELFTDYEFDLIALGISFGIAEANTATEIDYNKYSEWVITEEDGIEYLTCPFCGASYDINSSKEFCRWCGAILEEVDVNEI